MAAVDMLHIPRVSDSESVLLLLPQAAVHFEGKETAVESCCTSN